MSEKSTWLGWYFADEAETLRYYDGRKIKVGVTHEVKSDPVLCVVGLHASPTVYDALQHARGNILFRVELGGEIVHGDDKSVATKRTYIARIDAEPILRDFARKCALKVIHLWNCPRIVKEYLETGDETKRTAACSAAKSAFLANPQNRAGAAAWAAARVAAWDAARDAGRHEQQEQRELLEKTVVDAIENGRVT